MVIHNADKLRDVLAVPLAGPVTHHDHLCLQTIPAHCAILWFSAIFHFHAKACVFSLLIIWRGEKEGRRREGRGGEGRRREGGGGRGGEEEGRGGEGEGGEGRRRGEVKQGRRRGKEVKQGRRRGREVKQGRR